MESALFRICCERDPDPDDQRQRILAAISDGADVGSADKNGVTALHRAVRFRSLAAVRALIESGADVDQACRRNGSTPLHRAVTQTGAPGTAGRAKATEAIVALLLESGADPAIGNRQGKRPIDYAKSAKLREWLSQERR